VTPRIRRVHPDEGLRLRALRLEALADAPTAFGSTLAREQAFTEAVWHERATEGAAGGSRITYIAEDGDHWVGMVTGLLDLPDEPHPCLVGMYVQPAARARGVGGALVEAVLGWARRRGATRVGLWVTSTNLAAIGLYERSGFRVTGNTKPLDHTPSLSELQMVHDF
jgi:GNAT superfamily N-acetyltransferase